MKSRARDRVSLLELAAKGIIVQGAKRGSYAIEGMPRYCQHLREMAAGRGGEAGTTARERLGQAQASLQMIERLLQAVWWVGVALVIIFFVVDITILVLHWIGQ